MATADGQLRQAGGRAYELGADAGPGLCIATDPGGAADPGDVSVSEAEADSQAGAAPTGSDVDADRRAR
jgi:hypothetical protein